MDKGSAACSSIARMLDSMVCTTAGPLFRSNKQAASNGHPRCDLSRFRSSRSRARRTRRVSPPRNVAWPLNTLPSGLHYSNKLLSPSSSRPFVFVAASRRVTRGHECIVGRAVHASLASSRNSSPVHRNSWPMHDVVRHGRMRALGALMRLAWLREDVRIQSLGYSLTHACGGSLGMHGRSECEAAGAIKHQSFVTREHCRLGATAGGVPLHHLLIRDSDRHPARSIMPCAGCR
jgi:hypothetical protein